MSPKPGAPRLPGFFDSGASSHVLRVHRTRGARLHAHLGGCELLGTVTRVVLAPTDEAPCKVRAGDYPSACCTYTLALMCLSSLALALILSSFLVLTLSFALALAGALTFGRIEVHTVLL